MKISDIFWAILVALIWGFNFIVLKVGLNSFPPILFSALRFVFAAFPAVLFLKRHNIRWRWIISIGLSLGAVMSGLLYIGINVGMSPGLSSLVLQVQAVFTLILSAIVLRDPPILWQKIGITVAFGGMGLLFFDNFQSTSLLGLLLVMGAGLAWAISNIMIRLAGKIDMIRLTIWMSLVPPIPLLVVSAFFEKGQLSALSHITWLGTGIILYTGLISTVLAFTIWGKLIGTYSPNTVAPFSLLVPIFGIISSVLFLHEQFSTMEVTASLLVFAGLALVVFGKKIAKIFIRT